VIKIVRDATYVFATWIAVDIEGIGRLRNFIV